MSMKQQSSSRREREPTAAEYAKALDALRQTFVIDHGLRPKTRDPRLRPPAFVGRYRSEPLARLQVHRENDGLGIDVYLPGQFPPRHVRVPADDPIARGGREGTFDVPVDVANDLLARAEDRVHAVARSRHGRLTG